MSRPEAESGKAAVALARVADGTTRVVASGRGEQAEQIVERAREAGVEVQQDARRVEELLREESEGSSIPLEVYELMATVINFAQELNEARAAPGPGRATAEGGAPL